MLNTNKRRKCKTKDCERMVDEPYIYCSIECACYDGAFSTTKGENNGRKETLD